MSSANDVNADPSPEDDLPAREAAYETFVWENLRRNYLASYLHGMMGMTGFRLFNAPTFLPAYLHLVSGSNFIVGLALALQQAGGVISPLFAGAAVEHRKKVLTPAMWMGGLGRASILMTALCGWFLRGEPLVVALLFFIFMFGFFMGAQRVVFSLLMAKVIPIQRRGRLQAWRNASGGAIAAVLAWAAGRWFVEPNLFGNGYSTTFLFGFVFTSLGLSAVRLLIREPEPPTRRAPSRLRDRVREFPAMIRQDRAYAGFLLVQMLATSARIATPFYILYVGRYLGGGGALLGLLSFAFLGADTASNLLWGHLGDRTGFRLILAASLVTWLAATVALMTLHDTASVVAAFAGLGAAQAGYSMAAQTMILEFGHRNELPMRIAISTTAEAITATAGPLLGGVMAEALGYSAVFGSSLGLLATALLILATVVQDPRRRRAA